MTAGADAHPTGADAHPAGTDSPAARLGTVERGKLADLVVLKGDLTADPGVIRNPTVVFKDGVGYDPAKLIASVEGRVGVD